MIESYFVICCTADGLSFGEVSARELERRLGDGHYGLRRTKFCVKVPSVDGFCLSMKDDELLIIKGRIVEPQAVVTVSKWQAP